MFGQCIETASFVEWDKFLLPGHQHHFVAACRPCRQERMAKNRFRQTLAAIVSMRYHVLDDAVWGSSSCQILNDVEVARCFGDPRLLQKVNVKLR